MSAGPLEVRAYRDAFGIVNELDDPRGPTDDDDELAVPVDYAAAFGHIEAWRRHSDRLEASAAEGRFATQEMAARRGRPACAAHVRGLPVPAPDGAGRQHRLALGRLQRGRVRQRAGRDRARWPAAVVNQRTVTRLTDRSG